MVKKTRKYSSKTHKKSLGNRSLRRKKIISKRIGIGIGRGRGRGRGKKKKIISKRIGVGIGIGIGIGRGRGKKKKIISKRIGVGGGNNQVGGGFVWENLANLPTNTGLKAEQLINHLDAHLKKLCHKDMEYEDINYLKKNSGISKLNNAANEIGSNNAKTLIKELNHIINKTFGAVPVEVTAKFKKICNSVTNKWVLNESKKDIKLDSYINGQITFTYIDFYIACQLIKKFTVSTEVEIENVNKSRIRNLSSPLKGSFECKLDYKDINEFELTLNGINNKSLNFTLNIRESHFSWFLGRNENEFKIQSIVESKKILGVAGNRTILIKLLTGGNIDPETNENNFMRLSLCLYYIHKYYVLQKKLNKTDKTEMLTILKSPDILENYKNDWESYWKEKIINKTHPTHTNPAIIYQYQFLNEVFNEKNVPNLSDFFNQYSLTHVNNATNNPAEQIDQQSSDAINKLKAHLIYYEKKIAEMGRSHNSEFKSDINAIKKAILLQENVLDIISKQAAYLASAKINLKFIEDIKLNCDFYLRSRTGTETYYIKKENEKFFSDQSNSIINLYNINTKIETPVFSVNYKNYFIYYKLRDSDDLLPLFEVNDKISLQDIYISGKGDNIRKLGKNKPEYSFDKGDIDETTLSIYSNFIKVNNNIPKLVLNNVLQDDTNDAACDILKAAELKWKAAAEAAPADCDVVAAAEAAPADCDVVAATTAAAEAAEAATTAADGYAIPVTLDIKNWSESDLTEFNDRRKKYTYDFVIGDRCMVFDMVQLLPGTVRFVGDLVYEPLGRNRIGVELDQVHTDGHNGTFSKHKYFECDAGKGMVLKPEFVLSKTFLWEEMTSQGRMRPHPLPLAPDREVAFAGLSASSES
jgi:hypothetical protein